MKQNILPRSFADISSFLFFIIAVPFGYFFQLYYVLPNIHTVGSFWYNLHAVIGTFVMFNIMSNFVAIMITDCSVNRENTPSTSTAPSWMFCSACKVHIPPRAWHCRDCKTCILKRDHHCQFTGCCVGHHNHRYFLFFVLYTAIGSTYAFYFHSRFIYRCAAKYVSTPRQFSSFAFALARGLSYSMQNCVIMFYGMTFFGMAASVFFLHYHAGIVVRGLVMYERAKEIHDYQSASVKENITQVFGERWYLTWISPLIRSKLPCDGVNWVKLNPRD